MCNFENYLTNILCQEYDDANAAYGDAGWYVLMDEAKAGLITDIRVRHQPDTYK